MPHSQIAQDHWKSTVSVLLNVDGGTDTLGEKRTGKVTCQVLSMSSNSIRNFLRRWRREMKPTGAWADGGLLVSWHTDACDETPVFRGRMDGPPMNLVLFSFMTLLQTNLNSGVGNWALCAVSTHVYTQSQKLRNNSPKMGGRANVKERNGRIVLGPLCGARAGPKLQTAVHESPAAAQRAAVSHKASSY